MSSGARPTRRACAWWGSASCREARTAAAILTNILYGASPTSQAVLQRSIDTFKCNLTQVYGLTETTGAITFLAHHEHTGERMLSCGRATLGAEMKVVDADDNEVPHGEIGEIVYRGG